MEKRAIIAVVLSAVVFMLYIYFIAPDKPAPTKPAAEQTTSQNTAANQAAKTGQPQAGSAAGTAVQPAPAQAAASINKAASVVPKTVEVSNSLVKYRFSEAGGRLTSATLANYLEVLTKDAPHKELVGIDNPWQAPLAVSLTKTRLVGLENAFYTLQTPEGKFSAADNPVEIRFAWSSPEGVEIVKIFTIQPKNYLMGARVEVINRSGRALDDNLGFTMSARHEPKEGGNYAFKGFGAYVSKDLTEEDVDDLTKEPKIINGRVSWGGYENSYFLRALIPIQQEGSIKGSVLAGQQDNVVVQAKYTTPPFSLAVDQSIAFDFKIFTGPKDIHLLNELGHDLAYSLNMGWLDIVAKPFLYFLKFVDGMVGNFGLAIIILTIIVKMLFWPLMSKSYKSMKRMQSLQPQMTSLREKYKDDKQRLNQEMMGLYKTHKVNPMGGCLPMVVQIPVFIALYRLLDYAIELRHAPFFFWIKDMSAPDRLFEFPFSVPFMDPPFGIPVLTLLMGASMFIQQKMTPTPGDPTQAKVMLLMPIIFTFIFINFPAGLVLYWLVQNLLSIGQQTYINRKA